MKVCSPIVTWCSGIDKGADNVCGQKVWGELDAVEFGVYRLGQSIDCKGFGKAGDAFQEDVATAQEADKKILHKMFLTHNHLSHLQSEHIYKLALFLNSFVKLTNVYAFHIKC